ncbi:hypothetical protein FB567DRAFT_213281 [Paraphoma chrysanthemicola]|uniref:DUF2264 domain-containing protein n=1 Tax=Paraphoma chrysanthemicola TaxID=798071 RepID=A0A8K0VS91_9PLEO|nr:hypothetical protein FB567DRAFT_213281 [Paraphoma chrysanthemicola]
MPPLPGFSDNPFVTRQDLIRAATALIEPLHKYKSASNARIKIATSTGAGFSETAAQLEGFARPLWVVPDLLHLLTDPGTQKSGFDNDLKRAGLETWLSGLAAGVDPKSPEYWGDLFDIDQRMVEMESIAYALLLHPHLFVPTDPTTKGNLINWLNGINTHAMPRNNWLWFRVLVNAALVKSLDVPLADVKGYIDAAFEILDSFYLEDGWSSDGTWGEDRSQADYYSGSFAIQFAQLLFVRLYPEYDTARTERYVQQAKTFGTRYWRYFAPNGAAIPFGRSLTYRFAFAAFWSAAACSGIELPPPVDNIGVLKGLVLRHLRWWAAQDDMLNTDGSLSIGYTYPNMYMCEEYNSPQSVFWCLKSLLVVGLDEKHAFWTAEELGHPQDVNKIAGDHGRGISTQVPDVEYLPAPKHIMCNTAEHQFLLSAGQWTSKRFKAREAKYGKFAYSSSLGLSVPCGAFLEQVAPDSTLAVCFGEEEEEGWKVRWGPSDVEKGEVRAGEETVPILTSTWRPWKRRDVVIKTVLVPPVKRYPGWHLRVHRLKWTAKENGYDHTSDTLRVVDGGFSASAQTRSGFSIFESKCNDSFDSLGSNNTFTEGWWSNIEKSLVLSESGASGVVDLTAAFTTAKNETDSAGKSIRADPNTNIIYPRTLIPAIQHVIQSPTAGTSTYTFVTGVFAVDTHAPQSPSEVLEAWNDPPSGRVELIDNEIALSLQP